MVRSVITVIISLAIVIAGGIFEQKFVSATFEEMSGIFSKLDEDIKEENATKGQAVFAQEKWIEKKEYLHSFIPHNDIKEIDLWIAETVAYVSDGDFKEAKKKTVVILELLEQTPKIYSLRLENVF